MVTGLLFGNARAQFSKASIQATGLTCALCSNAINKALQKLSFIESVRSDIKNSEFSLVFKQNETVKIDALKEAVEDAGFSIGTLKLTGTFNNIAIEKDRHVTIGNDSYHFLNVSGNSLTGEQTLRVVDKNFVSEKEFKKFSQATKLSCVRTGIAAACCEKDGISANSRVYHVIN